MSGRDHRYDALSWRDLFDAIFHPRFDPPGTKGALEQIVWRGGTWGMAIETPKREYAHRPDVRAKKREQDKRRRKSELAPAAEA